MITNVLTKIFNFIKMLGQFLYNIVTSLATLFEYMLDATEYIISSLGIFPSIMVSVIIAGVSISIILMIVGRKT